jgi:hypothetical protein
MRPTGADSLQEMNSIEQQQKQRTQAYNLAKGGLSNIQRKKTCAGALRLCGGHEGFVLIQAAGTCRKDHYWTWCRKVT